MRLVRIGRGCEVTRRPITVAVDVDEALMNYDENDAKIIGAGVTDALYQYVVAGGELDKCAIDLEPIELDSMTGIRVLITGYHRDDTWEPGV
jgi:hypothetical protein